MKKISLVLALALLLMFSLTNLAFAATPDLKGTWTGTAKKITVLKCSNVPVSLAIINQCGMLFEGLLHIGTQDIIVVGKIYNDEISLRGTYGSYGFAVLTGNYTTSPSPRIVILTIMLMSGSDYSYYEEEYSVFPLLKQP
jgi:hypothetical protein